MKKVNSQQMEEMGRFSPRGKFGVQRKQISVELGREPFSTDLHKRQPFDVAIARIPPGKTLCPYHAHSAQFEFYLVISGSGLVRDQDGHTVVSAGDAFLFKPGEAHTLSNEGPADFVYYIIADNPFGECCHYPDSNKWWVQMPQDSRLIRSEGLDYFEGEE